MINIAICDDNTSNCSEIENILLKYAIKNNLKFNIDIFYSGEQLYKFLNKGNKYNIIFLDIELGKLSGIQLGLKIREDLADEITKIIYISSHESYAMKLFDIRPFNFLIKPINEDKLIELLDKIRIILNIDYNVFYYKKDKILNKIYIKDILYFEGCNKNTKLNTLKEQILIKDSLKDIFDRLYKYNFFYSHRSYLVNYNSIIKFESDRLIVANGDIIPISQPRRKYVKNLQIKFSKEI